MSAFGKWRHILLLSALASLSGCETPGADLLATPRSPPPTQVEPVPGKLAKTSGPPPPANASAGKTTFLEGTGRFIGTPQQPAPTHDEDVAEGGDGVTLNLVGVPTSQAAKTVLGDILRVKYTIDPSVKGEVTVQTPKPLVKSAVVDLFQSALRANGAAMVHANGLYKIVPADQAIVGASLQIPDAPAAKGKVGSGVHIVQLKYISATELQRILEPIAPRGSIVRADDARRIIMLSGTSQEIASVMEAIAIFDVDTMKGMSFALVPVRSSQPTVIAAELRSIFASDREGAAAGMVHFLPNNRLRAILVVTPQRQYLARAETWVRRLDAQAEGTEKQFFTYSVQNRRADELVSALQAMLSNDAGARSTGATRNVAPPHQEAGVQSSSLQPASHGSQSSFATPGGGGPRGPAGSSARSPTSFAGASPAPGPSPAGNGEQGAGEQRIKIAADGAKNAVLIEATPADYRRIMTMITALDVMPNQVLIEATIAEVSLNDDLKMGVRWFLERKNSTYKFTDAATGALGSVFPGFSYALTAADLVATLNTLNQVTDVNVVSSPSLTVMDNSTAILQIGDQVPITTQSATSVLGPGAPVVNSVSYRDTGVILSITPRINESGRVLLEIEQEVSTVVSTTSSGIDSPTIRQRRIRTGVVVSNGEALTLGGMIQESKTLARSQMPILGDLPFLGNAFKQKDNRYGKTELIIIITPRVMRNLDEARQVTDEYRREFERHVLHDRNKLRRLEKGVRRTFE